MASKQDIPALLASKDGFTELDDQAKQRLLHMVSDVEEVVGVEHLIDALQHGSSHGGDGVLRCYVGFEPSGKAHIGWKVLALQLRRMLDANANVMVFLADWHAWVNDKFNGDMDAIQTTGVYMQETFRALLGEQPEAEATVQAVHRGVLALESTSVRAMSAQIGLNARTFERFCKRHFGFAPRTLLRRQRFLRSLGEYMLDPSMRWIGSLDMHYWDQAHFIRDFRATMNMTPSEFAALPHPVIKAAVSVSNMNGGVAMQALYHPERLARPETGL